jgi:hypothetical protein
MSYYPDLSTETDVARGPHVRAIGWIHAADPFPTGPSTLAFVDRLDALTQHAGASSAALGFPDFMGSHTCELCGRAQGTQNLGVVWGSKLYVAPELVLHYVRVHAYRPPDEFVEAVLCSPLPGSAEFGALVEALRAHDASSAPGAR